MSGDDDEVNGFNTSMQALYNTQNNQVSSSNAGTQEAEQKSYGSGKAWAIGCSIIAIAVLIAVAIATYNL